MDKLAKTIEKMSGKSLKTFVDPNIPTELKPLITSFNSLMQRLDNSMQSERRFTDYAAHELKTPLSAITIQAELLIKNKNKAKEQEYSRELMEGITRMTHMVNQVLTLARLEPESDKIEKEKFALCQVVRNLLKDYEDRITKKNIQIEVLCELQEEKLIIEANKAYIEIMIGNLIDNAIKYSSDNKIIIKIDEKKEGLSFKITNSGNQISLEDQKKIFDNFYRVDNTSSEQGCGMGLAIVKKIVNLHKGLVFFESKNGKNSVEVIL